MNTQEYQIAKMTSQKRSREEDAQPTLSLTKKRQPKTLFRPWSDEQVMDLQPEAKGPSTAKKDNLLPNPTPNSINYQPKIVLPSAPVLISPYQLAVQQQQQRQTALALQQAIYQRQLIMAHVWAQQRQQQMIVQHHQQQQMRQQLFVFGQKPGPK